MIQTPIVIDVPLRTDEQGVIRVGSTRITLETLIAAYQRGDTAEQIVQGFPSLILADVHAIIAYYLSHKDAVHDYIRQIDAEGEEIRRKIEALESHKPLTRAMLLARLEAKKRDEE